MPIAASAPLRPSKRASVKMSPVRMRRRAVHTSEISGLGIANSHSPFVLNELTYEEVRLTTLDREGATLVGALTEHPDYARWKDHVQPGELRTSGLEDWLRSRQREAAA